MTAPLQSRNSGPDGTDPGRTETERIAPERDPQTDGPDPLTAGPTDGAKSLGLSPSVILVLALGAGAVYWVLRTLFNGDPDQDIAATAPQLWSAACATAAAASLVVGARRLSGKARTSWYLIAAGAGLWAAGTLWWVASMAVSTAPSYPSAVDALHLGAAPLIAAGVLIYPSGNRRERAYRSLIDGLLVGLSVLLILWSMGLQSTATIDHSALHGHAAMNVLHPLSTTFLVVMVILLLFSTRDNTTKSLVFLGLGLTVICVTQLAHLLLAALDMTEREMLGLDAGWSMGFMLMLAAGMFLRPTRQSIDTHRRVRAASTPMVVLPSTLGALALMVGLLQISTDSDSTALISPALFLVAGLLLARQSFTMSQRRKLTQDLARSVRELAHSAGHDQLTGLPNRTQLTRRLENHRRSTSDELGVVFLDINHLKAINDSLGHQVGDQLIVDTALALSDACHGAEVTRFGGDEFVTTVTAPTRAEVVKRAAELTDNVNESDLREGSLVTPTVSAGVALWEHGMDATEAMRRADTALCDAKATGRRRMVAYDPSMDAATRRRVELEPGLLKALDNGELQVHYQPVVSLVDDTVIGAEALVRWDHPTRGLLAPEQWLSDADASGLLESIGEFVLQTAAENFAELNRSATNMPLHIAVNMSTSELVARQAVRTVQETLRRTGLDPNHLVIEITEDVVLDDATRSTIDRLTDLGVSIAIDDFGTGNSSLRQLSGYPASSLKVDRTFVQGLGVNREDTVVVQSILRLARTLGLSTTAEGVESRIQAEMLAELGCNAAQGWYFDRAKPFPELREGRLRALSPLVPRVDTDH